MQTQALVGNVCDALLAIITRADRRSKERMVLQLHLCPALSHLLHMLCSESLEGGADRGAEKSGDSGKGSGAAISSSSSSSSSSSAGNTVRTALLIPEGGGVGTGGDGGDARGGELGGEAALERARVRLLESYLVLVSGVGFQCRALILNHTPSLSCLRLLLLAPAHEAPRGAVVGVGKGGGRRGQGRICGGVGEVSRRERGLVLDILAALQTGDDSREAVLVMLGFPLVLVSLVAFKLLSCRASQRAGEGGGGGGGGGGDGGGGGKALQEVEEGKLEEGGVERCDGEDGEEEEASEDEVSDGEEEDAQRTRYTLAPKLTARESTASILKSP